MPFPLILIPLVAQIGPGPAHILAPLPIPREQQTVHHRVISLPAPEQVRLNQCLTASEAQPAAAATIAEDWLRSAKGAARAEPLWCLGVAKARGDDWGAAQASFSAGLQAAAPADKIGRARLGALAGNAALANSAPDKALGLLDTAHGEALGAGDQALAGNIAIDRARALVMLHRENEAAAALAEARAQVPDEPQAWLLSATLSRRQHHLPEAQSAIERAAALLPADPEIGLEAGVIAVLSGRDEAARRSWQSVVSAAPGSALAKTAQGYLDQLGPPAASAAR